MLLASDDELDHARQQWLMARERLTPSGGREELDAFEHADRRLFAAFAADWTGSDNALLSAFQEFRRALVEQGDETRLRGIFLEGALAYARSGIGGNAGQCAARQRSTGL